MARLQARPRDGRPLSLGTESQIDQALAAFAYELAAKVGKSPAAGVTDDRQSRRSEIADVAPAASIRGEWAGFYNRTRPFRLLIRDVNGGTFRGVIEYSAEGTVTTVEGTLHEKWSIDDPIWAQVTGNTGSNQAVAVTFRETGYEHKGSGSISFDGEYRAIARGKTMAGAWFSGTRLVGSLLLEQQMP